MLRLLTIIALVIFVVMSVNAQDGIDRGGTGTLNLDYFNPQGDSHITWLKADQDKAHVQPAILAFAQGDFKRAKVELEYLLPRFVNHPQALALAAALAIAMKSP